MPDLPPCSDCNGRCCRWIIWAYEEEQEEITRLRGGLIVKIAGVKTYFAYKMECKMLTAQGLCSIYHKRPRFCRENPKDGFICELTRCLEAFQAKEGIISLP